jgi:hypothetical protein
MGLKHRLLEVLRSDSKKTRRASISLKKDEPTMLFQSPIQKHSSTLEQLLKNPQVYEKLYKFSKSEFCTENLELWRWLQIFATEKDPKTRKQVAEYIWNKYLAFDAPREANIPAQARKQIEEHIANGQCSPTLFSCIQQDVESMLSDVYLRFSLVADKI